MVLLLVRNYPRLEFILFYVLVLVFILAATVVVVAAGFPEQLRFANLPPHHILNSNVRRHSPPVHGCRHFVSLLVVGNWQLS